MKKFWKDWAGTLYLCALCMVIFLAVPLLPEGGYTAITQWKFRLYLLTNALFSVLWLCFGERRRHPRWLTGAILCWLLCSLLAALCSPWRRIAFLGGERCEGFLTLLCYGLSALWLSGQRLRGKPLLCCFTLGVLWLDGVSLLQLSGRNPLHLYPEGLSWFDANVRYSGAYLGTVGNAGLTGTVLACACCLFFLLCVQRGGRFRLLLFPLALTGWVLGRSRVDGPLLALLCVMALGLTAFARRQRALGRYICGSAVLLYVLLLPGTGGTVCCAAALLAGVLLERGGDRPLGRWPLAALLLLLTGAVLTIYGYTGENTTLREAAALLHGEADDSFGNGRLYIWRQVWQRAGERLWLGTGPDTLSQWELPPYEWYAEEAAVRVYAHIDAAHNEYLQTLACQGLPACLARFCLLLMAFRRFRQGGTRGIYGGSALCYGISALTGISACAAAPLFWALLALSEREERENEKDPDE